MLFAESYAGLLLLAHTILAAALVASATHLVVWMRGFPRGRFERLAATRRFAIITATLFVATFIFGNLIYPVYKVRVRAEYLDRPGAVLRDVRERAVSRARVEAEHYTLSGTTGGRAAELEAASERLDGQPEPKPEIDEAALLEEVNHYPRRAAKIARWFDVKEHWVALGMALSIGCAAILLAWNPKRHGAVIAPMVFLLALGAAASTWIGAIIGIVVTSYRAIGGVG